VNIHAFDVNSHAFDVDSHAFSVNSHAFDVNRYAFSVDSHAFSVNSHAFDVNSHAFSVDSHAFSVNSHAFNVNSHAFDVDRHALCIEFGFFLKKNTHIPKFSLNLGNQFIYLTKKKSIKMPFQDLAQNHFTVAETTAIDNALTAIETVLNAKNITNLNADERNEYGSIKEKNKLFANKVRDYQQTQPALSSPDVNWVEYEADYQDRQFIDRRVIRIAGIVERLTDKKMLHDYDNYQNGLNDYDYTKFKAGGSNGSGYDTKADELGQFFTGGPDKPDA
jgi:hypothetical protein